MLLALSNDHPPCARIGAMARNRKNESAAARFAPALKALLLCAFFVTAGVGYVWYKNQTKILGDQVRACEKTLYDLRVHNAALLSLLNEKRAPAALELQVKKLNLGLGPTTQIIFVTETVPEPLSSVEAARLAPEHRQARTGFMERGDLFCRCPCSFGGGTERRGRSADIFK